MNMSLRLAERYASSGFSLCHCENTTPEATNAGKSGTAILEQYILESKEILAEQCRRRLARGW